MFNFIRGRFKISLLFGVITFLCFTSNAPAGNTIKIGSVDPASGIYKTGGDIYYHCMNQAVYEQNQAGGLLGKKIELIREDGMMKPEIAVRKAKKLISKDKVDFLVGGLGSHIYLAVSKVAEEYKKIYVCTGAASDAITGKGFTRYLFRPGVTGTNSSYAFATYLSNRPYKKYYLINQDYAFGHDMARTFTEQLLKKNPDVTVVGEDFTPIGTKDFSSYITKILASGAEVVYCSFVGGDLTVFLKQADKLGLMKKALFALFWIDPPLAETVGSAIEGHIFANNFGITVDTPANKAFIKRYHERHKDLPMSLQYPWGYAGNTYNAMRFLFAVIKKAGSVDPEAIIKAWEGMEFEYTAAGKVKMRACDHQLLTPYFLFRGTKVSGSEKFFDFPYYIGKPIAKLSADECKIPMGTPGYNPRCK